MVIFLISASCATLLNLQVEAYNKPMNTNYDVIISLLEQRVKVLEP